MVSHDRSRAEMAGSLGLKAKEVSVNKNTTEDETEMDEN
jgi:hypothetical protein